jgi:diketogulonate reductase-like aldo/keto reductase
MSFSRRSVLKLGLGAGATVLLDALPACAQSQPALIRKAIPSSGEQIPVIGLGSSQTFDLAPGMSGWEEGRRVIRTFRDLGGKVIDTAPSYQRSELFIGETVRAFSIQNDLFLATKVNVGRQGKAAALAQMENSSRVFGKRNIDLMQVWNLGDSTRSLTDAFLQTHMEAVQEWKKSGRARYVGVTTSRDPQYADVEDAMKKYKFDFVQLDYAITRDERIPEQRLLPIAREQGIAVLVNRPFAAGGLFGYVSGKPLPPFAAEIGVRSWAQFFLKWIASHPAVTCVIPATGDVAHLRDNMGAGTGVLPDEATRKRMVTYFDSV